jgi:hypothetical protein
MIMTAKKAQPAAAPSFSVSNCNITNTSAANEHTREAVEALAAAAGKNADAIAEIARALKGAPATMQIGISIAQP